MKHRNILFYGDFKRIVLCLPTGSLHQHSKFIDRMEAICPGLEIHEGNPDMVQMGLMNDSNEHKLIIMGKYILTCVVNPVFPFPLSPPIFGPNFPYGNFFISCLENGFSR